MNAEPSTRRGAAAPPGGALFTARTGSDRRARLVGLPRGGWVVLSPHLDDAVLSCGNLLLALRSSGGATVGTFFTEQSAPHTWSARAFLRQCGAGSASALYDARRAEDARVMERIGADWRHAGLADALFRKRSAGSRAPRWARFLPELAHVYPTYRLHVATGRVARHDRATVGAVEDLVGRMLGEAGAGGPVTLVAPLGVGRHVDHVLVRDVAAASGARVAYYADVPYSLRQAPDAGFVRRRGLVPLQLPGVGVGKRELIHGYATQTGALFPDGVPDLADVLYVSATDLVVERDG